LNTNFLGLLTEKTQFFETIFYDVNYFTAFEEVNC